MAILRSLSQQDFDREFGSLYRSVFSGKGLDHGPFGSREWRKVLVPYGRNMEEQDFRGLALAAESCGDQEIIVADAETIQPSEKAVVIQASLAAFEEMQYRPGTNLGIMDVHLFGHSGRWGCVLAASLDDVAIVAGDSSFFGRFVEAVGGTDAIRGRFLRFSKEQWLVSDETRADLLRMVGW